MLLNLDEMAAPSPSHPYPAPPSLEPCGAVWYLAPRPHLPRGTLLLLAHLHRLRLRLGVAKPVIQSIFSKLAPRLAVLVPFSTGDQAL